MSESDYEDEFMIAEFKVSIPSEWIQQAKLLMKVSDSFKLQIMDNKGNVLAWFQKKKRG